MKTLITMKKNLALAAGLILAFAMMACNNGSPNNGPRQRGVVPQGVVNPNTGAVTVTSWGAITTPGSFSAQQLEVLTNGAQGIGYVSGNLNDTTGILFRGQVYQTGGGSLGTIGIGIWDSVAVQGGAPFYWDMPVVQIAPTGNGMNVTVQSDNTVLIFNGVFNGNMWQGTVTDPNNDQLGNFEIVSCSIFQC